MYKRRELSVAAAFKEQQKREMERQREIQTKAINDKIGKYVSFCQERGFICNMDMSLTSITKTLSEHLPLRLDNKQIVHLFKHSTNYTPGTIVDHLAYRLLPLDDFLRIHDYVKKAGTNVFMYTFIENVSQFVIKHLAVEYGLKTQ